jgi:hypothetical protein
MRKTIYSALILWLPVAFVYGQFPANPTQWSTPTGGQANDGYKVIGYDALGSDPSGTQSWTLADMNGDGKTDLLVTGATNGTIAKQFGEGSSPYWNLYLNTGTGFSSTATQWSTPSGGLPNDGYRVADYDAVGTDPSGTQSWALLDINGDGKPDLVVTAVSSGTISKQLGEGSSPYWNVHLNTGTGFSTTVTQWSTPTGGQANDGYKVIGYDALGSDPSGTQSWTLADMNGDGKPDLLVTGATNGTIAKQFGEGSSPYWNVYLNTGTGFSSTATQWSTPSGGLVNDGYRVADYDAVGTDPSGTQSWALLDINGDGKPDLVVTAVSSGSISKQFGEGSSPYWNVYLNASTLPSGIPEVSNLTTQCTLYPNPNNGNFIIEFTDDVVRDVEISDALGRTVMASIKVSRQQNFNVEELSAGIYIMRINNQGQEQSLKFTLVR